MRAIVVVAMLLLSALIVSTVSAVQQFSGPLKVLPSRSEPSPRFNAFHEGLVEPQAPGSGGGGDGVI